MRFFCIAIQCSFTLGDPDDSSVLEPLFFCLINMHVILDIFWLVAEVKVSAIITRAAKQKKKTYIIRCTSWNRNNLLNENKMHYNQNWEFICMLCAVVKPASVTVCTKPWTYKQTSHSAIWPQRNVEEHWRSWRLESSKNIAPYIFQTTCHIVKFAYMSDYL